MLPACETVCACKRKRALQGLQRRMAPISALLFNELMTQDTKMAASSRKQQ
jgi:hypothetical protein